MQYPAAAAVWQAAGKLAGKNTPRPTRKEPRLNRKARGAMASAGCPSAGDGDRLLRNAHTLRAEPAAQAEMPIKCHPGVRSAFV